MKTYIALIRGINVGGNNLLPMKALVTLLEKTGAQNVKTYIQSGNAVFQHSVKNPDHLSKQLAAEIKRRHGFEPFIFIIDLEAIKKAMANNPFPDAESEPDRLFLGFLAAIPGNPDLKKLNSLKAKSERFQLIDSVFYLHAPEGSGRSKLAANAEILLGVPKTDRNWKTVCKIRDLAGG